MLQAEIGSAIKALEMWSNEVFQELVSTNSFSENFPGVLAAQKILERELSAAGLVCEYLPSTDSAKHLVARNNSAQSSAKRIVLSCHVDTVYPPESWSGGLEVIDRDWLLGPGAADMKGGAIVILLALRAISSLKLIDKVPIMVISNACEERPCSGFTNLVNQLRDQIKFALVFEAARKNHGVVIARKGRAWGNLTIEGIETHAGNDPQGGISAILEASRIILALDQLNDYANGLTCNVGLIQGGTVANTIPGFCSFEFELRANTQRDLKFLINSITKFDGRRDSGAIVKVNVKSEGMPLEENQLSLVIFNSLKSVGKNWQLNLELSPRVGGLSDANYFASAGISSVDGLGPYGENFHVIGKERVLVKEIAQRAGLVAEWLITQQA
ncbi:M20/M25/M40 family metallo-hydrolase [bacterium]|nr:M20/M25/M40 family metallo-hydrolase [bacterium]